MATYGHCLHSAKMKTSCVHSRLIQDVANFKWILGNARHMKRLHLLNNNLVSGCQCKTQLLHAIFKNPMSTYYYITNKKASL
jgi:hypothetical protein